MLDRFVDEFDEDKWSPEEDDADRLESKLLRRKVSELSETSEDVLMPESMVGLADFREDDSVFAGNAALPECVCFSSRVSV